ncbi:MAG: S41 family peptidase [Chthoniobacterales bacterium]
MLRNLLAAIAMAGLPAIAVIAQTPPAVAPTTNTSPGPTAVKPSVATPTPSPVATPTPAPSREELLNSLTAADLQAALGLVRKNFTNPDLVDEAELNRATLQGLLVRLNKGLLLLPGKTPAAPDATAPLYAEILEGHVGYVRPGALNAANVQAFDKRLADFAAKKVTALLLDLRASDSGDFGAAAEFAKRLVPKGKTLFSLRKQDKQEQTFASDREPAYNGLVVALIDGDVGGPAEALAVALRTHDNTLLIGQPTAGGGVEYSDLPLPSGKLLRVAVAQCIAADGRRLYPTGVNPDLPVEMSPMDKRQIFRLSISKGIAPFTRESERPHLNEAALIAGTNPELETAEQRRARLQSNGLVDPVLQRGLDLITSLEVFRKR